MKPEARGNLEDLFHAAREIEAEKRDAFLDEARGGDAALRLRVERMLAENPDDDSLLGKPAMDFVTGLLSPAAPQTITSGTLLEHYRILDVLGAGGMGTVYRARDLKLDRDVAIKVLPREFSMDSERLQRFSREAKLLAALNHPHIAAIFGLVESQDVRGLVLELVEGPTLADRLAKGPVPVDEALSVALQITQAVEAAHGQEIIHRDLKPANIKLTSGGQVKVLDFGLAKALTKASPADAPPDLSFDGVLSAEPRIAGTAAYMSPEQARGAAVGKGSDIWAFGCIVYELITGRRAFPGETFGEIIGNVLHQEPVWDALPASTPESIRRLLRRCLKKDAARRLQDIGDARIEIEDALQPSPIASARVPIPGALRSRGGRFLIELLFVLIAGILLRFALSPAPATAPSVRLDSSPPRGTNFATSTGAADSPVELSPDGLKLAFVANVDGKRQIWVRLFESSIAQRLPGTEDVR